MSYFVFVLSCVDDLVGDFVLCCSLVAVIGYVDVVSVLYCCVGNLVSWFGWCCVAL